MTTWRRGPSARHSGPAAQEGSLVDFVEHVRTRTSRGCRAPRSSRTRTRTPTPLALRALVKHNHILHEHVIIVSIVTAKVPHVPTEEAFEYDDLGYADDGIEFLNIRFGFSDKPDIPRALRAACRAGILPLDAANFKKASYFISRGAIRTTRTQGMVRWRSFPVRRARAQRRGPWPPASACRRCGR